MKTAIRPALLRFSVIDERLRGQTWPNASSLARELEVTSRTIHRDFDFLRDRFHAPIALDARRNGYFYSDPNYRLPYFSISEGEYVALFLAERLLQEYQGTPYATVLSRFFEKVTSLLTDPVTVDLQHLAHSLSFRPTTSTVYDPATMEQLHAAIRQCRRLKIVYWTASRNQTTRRVVDPYHLAAIDGDWYLVAYCHRREEVLMFSPQRICELQETDETFAPDPDFRINDYLDVGFRKLRGAGRAHTVRLRFAPSAARYVREKIWHPVSCRVTLSIACCATWCR